MLALWMISIIATAFLAENKKRSVLGWLLLSLPLGPIALLAVIILPKVEQKQKITTVQSPGISLRSLKADLEGLKEEFSALSNKLSNLGEKISALEGKDETQLEPEPEVLEKEAPQQAPVPAISEQPPSRKTDIEMDLGKFWLNKIGMIVFSLGVAFLLTYTLARIGPAAKIALGYLIGAGLFIMGRKLEGMGKFVNYGRVLLGGSWAIIYFTTYAMHHFEASRIINSQLLGLFLLAVVSLGIIAHSLRYKSEALTAITLFIGYFTSVLGDVGYFTLISAALLGVVALVMVYKMQWVRFIFVGIILTYLTHFIWVIKQISFSLVPIGRLNVENVYFHFDAGFLLIYWALFAAAIHLIRNKEGSAVCKRLAAANFSNFILFFFMVYPKFYFFYPDYKFNAVLVFGLAYMALAAIMDSAKRNELFISDTIIAVSLLTVSIPLKFLPYQTTVIWLIELPFLLFAGFIFERKVYRYLAFALSGVVFSRFIFWDWCLASLSFMGFVSTAVCFGLYRLLENRKDVASCEKPLKNLYSGFSAAYLTMYVWDVVKPLWLTLGLSLESLLIFALGALLADRYIRRYALAVFALAGMRFCFYGVSRNAGELQQLFLVYGPAACAFAEYFIYRRLNRKSLIPEDEAWLAKILFFAAASLFVFAIVVYVQQVWITLSLAVTAIFTLLWGARISDKHIRVYALLILLFASVRFSLIDTYHNLDKLFQWALIFLKLACAYAAYFIYRLLDKKSRLDESEKCLVSPLFYAGSFLVVLAVFKYVKDIWVAVSLGVAGALLFASGFLIKEKIFRHAGFVIFAVTLARIVFVDLSGLAIIYKIISFIILGVLFLGVSFIYTKYAAEKKD